MNKVKAQIEKFSNKDNKNADTNPNSTNAGPHDSNMANRADPRVDSDRDGSRNIGARDDYNNTTGNNFNNNNSTFDNNTTTGSGAGANQQENMKSTNHGPHGSNMMNKADPRVDSDRDGSRNMGARSDRDNFNNNSSGFNNDSSNYGNNSTNAGPHNSNMANKADPRVDSDMDGSRNMGARSGNTGFNNNSSNYGNTSTNAGPHDSNLANKTDPRVDSDMDGSRNMGARSGNTGFNNNSSYGNTSTNAGPHDSNMANKADPRVDSDMDGSRNMGARSGTTGTGYDSTSNSGAGANQQENYKSTNHGPHGSNMMNKADPRVDSDMDGSRNMGARSDKGNDFDNRNPSMATANTGSHEKHHHHDKHPHNDASHLATGLADKTAGPHKSDMMNKMDPRVDSDLDGHRNQKFHESGDINSGNNFEGRNQTGDFNSGNNFQDHQSANHQENFQSSNHGPHKQNMMNKADPRVDSDLDNTRGGAVQGPSGGNYNTNSY